MQRNIRIILLAGALAACTPQHRDDAAAVLAAQRAILTASNAGDCGRLNALIADGYAIRFQPSVGAREWRYSDKSRSIAHWCEADPSALPSQIDAQRAVISEDTAIAFARITDRAQGPDGAEQRWVTEVSDTFVRRNGSWVLLASHEALVEEPASHSSSSTSQ